MIVDSHLHVWSGDGAAYPFAEGRKTPEPAPVELLAETMEAAGVDAAVIVQPIHYLHDNGYVSDCLRRYGRRFAGVGVIDQKAPDAVERYDELRDAGFEGLRIHLASRVPEPSDWATADQDALWQRVGDTGGSFCLHGPSRHLRAIEPIIARFPGVKVVLDHLGGPPAPADDVDGQGLALALNLARYPQVYVKLTPQGHKSTQDYPHADLFDLYRRYYDAFGPQRLMWGTNFPGILRTTGYEPALALFRDHLDFFSPADRQRLLGGTACEVWPRLVQP